MGTLLILGGSNCQINAFKYARQNNIKTVLFDYYDDPPAARLADAHYKLSTFDVRGCLELASKLKIDGVMTLGTDQPVYTSAVIANRLGLPSFLDEKTALSVTNKEIMKSVLYEHGIPAASSYVVDKSGLEALNIRSSVVIKPLDGQGQKGVFFACGTRQAAEWFDEVLSFSRLDRIMCEKYYPSNEVTVSAWVSNDVCRILTVTDRMTAIKGRSIGVCLAHHFPSRFAEGHEERISELAAGIVKAFGIHNGPLYIQMLIGSGGVLVNEVACRIGGAFEDVFIPRVMGFDILAHTVNGALGINTSPEIHAYDKSAGYAKVLMLFTKQRVIRWLPRLSDIMSIPFIYDAGFNYNIGDTVPVFENSSARIGYAVFMTETYAQMESSIAAFSRMMGCDYENG